ncbi:A/G-specific DNA-adenine glycosylase [Sphaerotilus hippei]|uniref:Adenine DNA glycosylase n=1 Tax=Sphaerotilus hippei TaxID=744406 RepID=A0A318GWQ6_9BURK|nr:A/G-specific DNA-adenine glycosylase [Sphaerotilus hippei]
MPDVATPLVRWQRISGRHALPWQQTRDPYRVWLSEIMLQQTQVTTVLAYYARFLERFPGVADLAAAPLDEVLALWAGLGYYSRARNLHRCAQAVVAQHGGAFPDRAAVLAELPGIGRSTAAAIAAFCFGERVAILDGNVKRVLGRVLAFEGDLAQAAQERALWAQAQALLPLAASDMPAYTQGLMDLGASLCGPRSTQCDACPLADRCRARQLARVAEFPVKTRKLVRKAMASWTLWISSGDAVWLQQRPERGVWAGLWTMPLFDDEATLQSAVRGLVEAQPAAVAGASPWVCRETPPGLAPADLLETEPEPDSLGLWTLPAFVHVLTHRDWTLHPRRLVLRGDAGPPPLSAALGPGRWVSRDGLAAVGLPTPMRRLLTPR